MLEELFNKGYLQYEKIILDNARSLGLTAEETVILIQLLKDKKLSIENLQKNLLITVDKIDKNMSSLMERGYYEIYLSYDNGKASECVSFAPLFTKLEAILNNIEEKTDDYDLSKLNDYLTEKMKRVLTSNELEVLQSWIFEDHYTYDEVVNAIDGIVEKKRALSVRTITQALANKKVDSNPKKEVPKALMEFYNKI